MPPARKPETGEPVEKKRRAATPAGVNESSKVAKLLGDLVTGRSQPSRDPNPGVDQESSPYRRQTTDEVG